MNALSNSWRLVKASASVLQADKELLIFPILSGIGTLIVTATFFIPMFLAHFFDAVFAGNNQVLGFVILFFFYVVNYTVIYFANTALVGAAMIRLRGGDPTVNDGMRVAGSHFGAILGYALISATVGMILKLISERSKGIGRMIISLIGFAWNIATYLVVPVLAVEGLGPFEAIKRSVALLKKTWGEQIAGNLGLGLFFGLVTIGTILLFVALFVGAAYIQSAVLMIGLGVLLVLILLVLGTIQTALNGIYTAAVYQYAAEGVSGSFFEADLVQNAFKQK